jgi:thiol:disulfide interchange protein DsbC
MEATVNIRSCRLLAGAALVAFAHVALAGAPADPAIIVASRNLGVKPEELHASAMPGVLELMQGTDAIYVSADGRYAIAGDLYDLRSKDDLTESRRRQVRRDLLASISESQMVIFGSAREPYTVTVFTDLDCAYCRKLHSEIAQFNQMGIRVRYLLFARSGPDSPSWTRAEQVWCAADRNEALTRAKRGETLDAQPCADTPLARNYALGKSMGVTGTPAIVLSNGEVRLGYVPAAELVEQLRALTR